MTRSDDISARDRPAPDLQERDLQERIARLERLLDGLEATRRAGPRPAGTATASGETGASSIDRLRDVAALVQTRATAATLDAGDALAMRALIEQLVAITSELRALASEIGTHLHGVAAAVDDGDTRLKTLEELK